MLACTYSMVVKMPHSTAIKRKKTENACFKLWMSSETAKDCCSVYKPETETIKSKIKACLSQ